MSANISVPTKRKRVFYKINLRFMSTPILKYKHTLTEANLSSRITDSEGKYFIKVDIFRVSEQNFKS